MRQLSFLLTALSLSFFSCQKPNAAPSAETAAPSGPTRFQLIPAEQSGISFANKLQETDGFNYLNFSYLYMSGAVAAGDFDNDGLTDLYFAATMGDNKLYRNTGNFKFEDISARAGLEAANQGIKTGVCLVDINGDGWLDIYQCRTGPTPEDRGNLLFVNNRDGSFSEQAAAYGLDAHCASTHANFFDYDLDGDLDCYLLNHRTDFDNTSNVRVEPSAEGGFKRIFTPQNEYESDRLYQNDGKGKFTDVSKKAGIENSAFGLSVTIQDVNRDGYPDIYVGNDYIEPDNLYINNRNGTFTDRINEYMRHTTAFSMGADFADLDNDGLADLVELDMSPESNEKQKLTATSQTNERYYSLVNYGYGHQIMRNMLQHNTGATGAGAFSEIGCLAGVASTDWSWAPLLQDFDNDGWRDMVITNGHRRDVTNLDYMHFTYDSLMKAGGKITDVKAYLNKIPMTELHSYAYRNKGDMSFENVTSSWGFASKTLSNGGVYADFDNDGDLDVVVVNAEKPAFLYKNTSRETDAAGANYLQVKLEGPAQNPHGTGAVVIVEAGGLHQVADANPIRGFLSTSTDILHFGLGKLQQVDKLQVQWPGGKVQTLEHVAANQRQVLRYADAKPGPSILPPPKSGALAAAVFADVTATSGLHYQHRENAFFDFDRERLLPHKCSDFGPALAVGDVNGDGLDDLYIGADFKHQGALFVQDRSARFRMADQKPFAQDSLFEDVAAVFLDADGDKDLDLYVVSGGNEAPAGKVFYQDRMYLNDGKGVLKMTPLLPQETESGGCVAAFDYDRDGDLDLFVGGRVTPGSYPRTPQSFVLQNNGGRFFNVTAQVAPDLSQLGMITDLVFADLDQDGQPELIACGEWTAIEVFRNQNGHFLRAPAAFGLSGYTGWWNCVAAADLDGDGDVDLAAGNLGLNTRYRASPTAPLRLYSKDFDNNGSIDPLLSFYENGVEHPVPFRDPLLKQLPELKKKFVNYSSYARAGMTDLYPEPVLKTAQRLEATELRNCWFENQSGKFTAHPLPNAAQVAPGKDLLISDFDGNGSPDLLFAGNDYGLDVETGRADAGNGVLLLNDGKGNFKPVPNREHGFWAGYEARRLAMIRLANGKSAVLVANHNGPLQAFSFQGARKGD